MSNAVRKLMQQCATEASADTVIRTWVWSLLEHFDEAPEEQKRRLYEDALFTAYGAVFRIAANDPDLLEDLRQGQAGDDPGE